MDITLSVNRRRSCSPGRSSDFLKILTLINGVKDAGPRGLMLPSGLALLVTFLVATTFCLAEATQGGKGLFGPQFKDAVHCGGEAQGQERGTHVAALIGNQRIVNT